MHRCLYLLHISKFYFSGMILFMTIYPKAASYTSARLFLQLDLDEVLYGKVNLRLVLLEAKAKLVAILCLLGCKNTNGQLKL